MFDALRLLFVFFLFRFSCDTEARTPQRLQTIKKLVGALFRSWFVVGLDEVDSMRPLGLMDKASDF